MPRTTKVRPDGRAVRARRESLGLTQAQLGQLAGRHADTIGDIECERWPVSKILMGQLARVLKVKPESLIKDEAA